MRGPERSILCVAAAAFLLTAAAAALPQEAGLAASGRYTAQRRPRVTVLEFEGAKADTTLAPSVEAMLETFLKRESQFVVVERQKLGGLLAERQRMQKGIVNISPGDTTSRELLEKIDLFVQGTVTLLDQPRGPRIEIDANLTAYDGRLVAAAQRGGPAACLRAIVRRLGIALEQDFLRPYYGRLQLNLTQPENVRIFLTPIPLGSAPDVEKPPPERSFTVTSGGEYDVVESWITDPTSYPVENLLSGWYSMRLARPGYEDLETDAARWEVRSRSGKPEVYDRLTGQPLSRTDPEPRRFVVCVDPLATAAINGDALGFAFRKQGGSLAPRVKRQYLDDEFSHVPQRVVLMGGRGLRLNDDLEESEDSTDDSECDLFDERQPTPPEFDLTHILPGQTFDFDHFKGGELIIDDYRGELVPVGQYQLALWDPNYQVEKTGVIVRDQELEKVTQTALARQTWTLKLEVTGARPSSRVILEGRDTGYRLELPLDFTDPREQRGLPADVYLASTDIPGLDGWRQTVDLMPRNDPPPKYFTRSAPYKPKIDRPSEDDKKPALGASLTIKTRFAFAGRLDVLSRRQETTADLFIDREVLKILDSLLHGRQLQPGLPGDPDELREQLAGRLKLIDLLVLDPRDMAQLRKSPESAGVIRRYVQEGGALFAFVVEAGEYAEAVGAPLRIEIAGDPTARFELAPGDVAGIVPRLERRVDVRSRRLLPELSGLSPKGPWRVLAFTQRRHGPRIVERGEWEEGGYIALWLDEPASFRGRLGKAVPKVEKARAEVEEHVLQWARYLMLRRYDKGGEQRRKAQMELKR